MGGVDVGDSGGKKRSTNTEINMVPFIDLLMCTISFLLLTAVWVTNSRINADAQVPGPPDPNQELTPQTPEKVLNLHIAENDFGLVWKQGATVVSEVRVPKVPVEIKDGGRTLVRYPELGKKIEEEWKQQGGHRDPSDKKLDQAILHTDNRLPFKEIIAVLDALYSPKREMKMADGQVKPIPAFNMTFSVR
ncbi:biopolymer transporter ExbD [Chondromyces apiculatus]|uniref:TolR protein n=1 Tax=Chondromyces apiculatus DSM 436 TaxID=1192034 RepID=A0A017SVC3_9BACT|nr:biopolymer transporter ExbD [Chondromyces apiculatus]EYF00712.1 TolR protein [Chondromyces apiculatus DSM 436]